jgi:GT2 family glycosyltransferase
VVVDHNRALAQRARAELAAGDRPVRVLENRHQPGLSGARNTAIEDIACDAWDVIAFLHDDAVADGRWLAELLAAYADPAVIAVGGPAWPWWPGPRRPAALPPALHWVVGCTTPGEVERGTPGAESNEARSLMGCNMSFRRSAFVTVGGFSENPGLLGEVPLGCEETEFCTRLRERMPNARIVLQPRAAVQHRVGHERATWHHLRRRCWTEGISRASSGGPLAGAREAPASEDRYPWRSLPGAVFTEVRTVWRAVFGLDGAALRRGVGGAVALPFALAVIGLGYLRGRLGMRSLYPPRRHSSRVSAQRAVAWLLAVIGLLACVLALAGTGGGARLAATLVFLLLGPGWAIVGFLRQVSLALRWLLSIATGISVGIVVGQAMAMLEFWHPVGALYLAAVVFVPLLVRHATVRASTVGAAGATR